MPKLSFVFLATWLAQLAVAKDVYLSWNVTWVNAAPDGFERPVIGINGQWPCPQIDVDLGDRLIVDLYNGLGDQSTGIHWHGFSQYMTGVMDGSSEVTQCPLPPGQHMRYDFQVNQVGTYWYHSHNMGQYPDGFRGPFIVHDPSPPFSYDDEFTITLSDWYHHQMPELLNSYQSVANTKAGGHEPIPDSTLINDSTDTKIKVKPNKTYLVHILCIGNWPGHTWIFDDHNMTLVEVDGVYVEPVLVEPKMLRLAPGQRYSVLIRTKSDASKNYAIWDTMDINMMFIYENRRIPAGYNPNATAWLVYDEAKPLPPPPVIRAFNFLDDVALTPLDLEPLLEPVNHQIVLDTFSRVIDGVTRFTVNNETYIPQKTPTLYTAMTVGHNFSSKPAVYGQVNPFVVKHGEVVEIVINNHHNNLHPWHLHGHHFQVVQRTDVNGGYFTGHYKNVSPTPVRRDTIMVQNHGHAVLRFRADNPGVWLLHCHIEWHVESGLMATIIEAPETFSRSEMSPPANHLRACAAYPEPSRGNAAGKHGHHLKGANTEVYPGSSGAMYPPPPPGASGKRPVSSHGQAITSGDSVQPPVHQTPHPPEESDDSVQPPVHPTPHPPEESDDSVQPPVCPIPPSPEEPDEPIIIHSDDSKGPWPYPYKNEAYVQVGDHTIQTHDSGPDDLPHNYQYWEKHEN